MLEVNQARRVLDVESTTELVLVNASACWTFIAGCTYGIPLNIRSYSSHHGGATWAVMSSVMTERFFVAAMVAMIFSTISRCKGLELSDCYWRSNVLAMWRD
jgi:hypothetical protein